MPKLASFSKFVRKIFGETNQTITTANNNSNYLRIANSPISFLLFWVHFLHRTFGEKTRWRENSNVKVKRRRPFSRCKPLLLFFRIFFAFEYSSIFDDRKCRVMLEIDLCCQHVRNINLAIRLDSVQEEISVASMSSTSLHSGNISGNGISCCHQTVLINKLPWLIFLMAR